MDRRLERILENEARFRQINEDLVHIADADATELMDILCECGAAGCTQLIPISRADYETARSEPTDFVVKPGHEIAAVEHVIETRGDYLIVRKREGLPAEVAEATDPRS